MEINKYITTYAKDQTADNDYTNCDALVQMLRTKYYHYHITLVVS